MIETNSLIEQGFFTKLKAALSPINVPVFIGYVPNELLSNQYVEFTVVSQTDDSNMNAAYSEAIVTVKIYTRGLPINDGQSINSIAAKVYEALMPNNLSTITLNGKAAVVTMTSDINQSINLSQDEIFINRFITFTLKSIFNN